MGIERAINVEDLRKLAKKRLPRIAFDFIEGGCDDEDGLSRNERSFRNMALVPRYMVDVSSRDQTTTLFGRSYASPFGISPTGLAALFRRGADLMLAQAARDANLPFVMSGTSTGSIEDLARVAPEHGWYQLYAARDRKISEDMIRRARDAGLSTLAITVDVPMGSKRERNLRNGFTRPLKLSLATRLDALRYPGWLADYLRHGMPMFSNWAPYAGPNADADTVASFVSAQTRATLTWDEIAHFRQLWPRTLVLKGIMHPEDAVRAADLGVDGIVVSNHGARQLDRAPSALDVLPAIAAAVGDRLTLMLDGGVRRGADIVIALCMGAKFVFLGRPTLYGAAAGGMAGVARAIAILRDEIDVTQAQIGAPRLADLGPQFLMWDRGAEPPRSAPVGLTVAAAQ